MNLKSPHFSVFLIKIFIFLFISLNSVSFCYSQNMPVPENIQAALLPKVLKFSPEISSKEKITMLIVYDKNSESSKDQIKSELDGFIVVKGILKSELEKNISECNLVYFMPGLQEEAILCKKYKVLSVTGISAYVERGEVSLGFGVRNNKPKILVNLKSLENEGQSLSSEVLRISIIFK